MSLIDAFLFFPFFLFIFVVTPSERLELTWGEYLKLEKENSRHTQNGYLALKGIVWYHYSWPV